MEFLIITGLSGAGKSRAADVLEDLDYYCVDNMPVALMPRFAELCLATRGRYERVALARGNAKEPRTHAPRHDSHRGGGQRNERGTGVSAKVHHAAHGVCNSG